MPSAASARSTRSPSTARVVASLTTARRRPSPSGATRSASRPERLALDRDGAHRHPERRAAIGVAAMRRAARDRARPARGSSPMDSFGAASRDACVASREDVEDLAAQRSLRRRERAVENRRADRERVDAGLRQGRESAAANARCRRRSASHPVTPARAARTRSSGSASVARYASRSTPPQPDARARAAMLGDERGRAFQPGRVADRAARKREVARELPQNALGGGEIGAAQDPVDAEGAPHLQRAQHGVRRGAHDFQVADPAARAGFVAHSSRIGAGDTPTSLKPMCRTPRSHAAFDRGTPRPRPSGRCG